jgi:hypothetical protein
MKIEAVKTGNTPINLSSYYDYYTSETAARESYRTRVNPLYYHGIATTPTLTRYGKQIVKPKIKSKITCEILGEE